MMGPDIGRNAFRRPTGPATAFVRAQGGRSPARADIQDQQRRAAQGELAGIHSRLATYFENPRAAYARIMDEGLAPQGHAAVVVDDARRLLRQASEMTLSPDSPTELVGLKVGLAAAAEGVMSSGWRRAAHEGVSHLPDGTDLSPLSVDWQRISVPLGRDPVDQSAVLMSALEEGLSDEVARHAALELQLPVGSTLSDEVRAWIADRLLSMAQDPQLDPGRFSESPMPVIDLRVRLARLASAVTVADTAMFTTVINAVPERAAEMRELLNRRNPDGTPTFPVSDFVPVIAQLAFAGRADLNNPAIEVLVGLHTAAIGFVGESAVPENLEPLERAYFEKKPLNVALSAAVEDVLAAQ